MGPLIAWADLPGWGTAQARDLLGAFLLSAPTVLDEGRSASGTARRALVPPPALVDAAAAALRDADALRAEPDAARAFFERRFEPVRVAADPADASRRGFATAYYEPLVPASRTRSPAFPVPAFGRPDALVTLPAGPDAAEAARAEGLDLGALPPGLSSALRGPDGRLAPAPTRETIEAATDAALAPGGPGEAGLPFAPVAWLADRVELFMIQVQGSARLAFPDGSRARLAYAGRNGHPYTGIGRVLAERGVAAPADLTLPKLKAWLRANGAEGAAVMRLNRSYVFFSLEEDAAHGPVGGAGVPLLTGRSVAVDRGLWPYGLPFVLSGALPANAARRMGAEPAGEGVGDALAAFARAVVAHDTGSAILGPARFDLFLGTGDAAGEAAGAVRHPVDAVALWPRHDR